MTARDLIFPSFFADSISLGPHWIYDAEELQMLYPEGISEYDRPRSPYHSGKSAGDLTHYGDQALELLRSIAKNGWSIDAWRSDWKQWAETTDAYIDGASKRSLENLQAGLDQPSDSSELSGASRIAPLFAMLDHEDLIHAARAQTAITHGDPQVIDAAEFFSRAAVGIRDGATFDQAFDQATSHPYDSLAAIDWLADARQAAEGDLTENAKRIGLACNISQALPLTLALALTFENDPVMALTTNALLGGDSAARGLPLGLLLGARHGLDAFPESWLRNLNAGEEIDSLLDSLGQSEA
ncbi:ADP-ribosylglycohydrolase family protein [Haloferula chungangensis]|uniref:ADP-ribosylglycohydrolase family protein n=1 Tax=Haloferula chungangensis TaxID=1048331 RepID=A0ABW2LBN0_9BACT